MNTIRRSNERGFADHGWLKSFHTFSFGDYFDPKHVEFGPLRVINEDRVVPGAGFGTHGHRDMEIISYVLEGELAHKDSMGNGSTIRPGDVQRMSAAAACGTASSTPARAPVPISCRSGSSRTPAASSRATRKRPSPPLRSAGRLRLIVSPDASEGSVLIHQDARVYAGLIDGEERAKLEVAPGRRMYLHVARGSVTANAGGGSPVALDAGDALELTNTPSLALEHGRNAEVLAIRPAGSVRRRRRSAASPAAGRGALIGDDGLPVEDGVPQQR